MSTSIRESDRLQFDHGVNDNRYFFRWSHGWYLGDVSGKAMRVRNIGYFVRMLLYVMCYGMVGFIYRVRKFCRRLRWEG